VSGRINPVRKVCLVDLRVHIVTIVVAGHPGGHSYELVNEIGGGAAGLRHIGHSDQIPQKQVFHLISVSRRNSDMLGTAGVFFRMETTANFHCLVPDSPGLMGAPSNAALAGTGLGGAGGLGVVWARATTAAKMKTGSSNPNDRILLSVDDTVRAPQFKEYQRPRAGWREGLVERFRNACKVTFAATTNPGMPRFVMYFQSPSQIYYC
jgi:hypothetical protein